MDHAVETALTGHSERGSAVRSRVVDG